MRYAAAAEQGCRLWAAAAWPPVASQRTFVALYLLDVVIGVHLRVAGSVQQLLVARKLLLLNIVSIALLVVFHPLQVLIMLLQCHRCRCGGA